MAFVEIARGRKYTLYQDESNPLVRRATIGIDDKYHQDTSGAWQPVNESFVDDPVYGGKSCNTVQHKFQVANGGKREFAGATCSGGERGGKTTRTRTREPGGGTGLERKY